MSNARAIVKQHVEKAGGIAAVAALIGVHRTNLYRALEGADLSPRHRSALRALLPRVPARVWADVWAPLPQTSRAGEP